MGDAGQPNGLNSNTTQANNKLSSFTALEAEGVWIPEYTVRQERAREWIEEGKTVMCRTRLRGSGGTDIVVATCTDELVRAPLYTKYIRKAEEYRVHVFNGRVIDLQRKVRPQTVDNSDANWFVRSHSNGFIFQRSGVAIPDDIKAMCVVAVEACGLDFGAVDIIYNSHYDKYYVLEVNTAPGLEGQTIISYADAIESYTNGRRRIENE